MFKVAASDFFFFSLAEPFIKTETKKNFAILYFILFVVESKYFMEKCCL